MNSEQAKKYQVPEGMLRAAVEAHHQRALKEGNFSDEYWNAVLNHVRPYLQDVLLAALEWLAENPLVPTVYQAADIMTAYAENNDRVLIVCAFTSEWQRRMFLAPVQEKQEEKPTIEQRLKTLEEAVIYMSGLQERLNKR